MDIQVSGLKQEVSTPQASQDEQRDYDAFVAQGFQYIYGKETGDVVEKQLTESKGDPIVIGRMLAMIVLSLYRSATKSGRKLDGDLVINAGIELCEEIVDYAINMGLIPVDQSQEVGANILMQAVRTYGDAMLAQGLITPEMKEEAKAIISQRLIAENQSKPSGVKAAVSDVANKGLLGEAA